MTDLYAFSTISLEGKPVKLDAFRGKVALVVNTASQCSFTPQYAGLEELHKVFHAKGFYVLGFPCVPGRTRRARGQALRLVDDAAEHHSRHRETAGNLNAD